MNRGILTPCHAPVATPRPLLGQPAELSLPGAHWHPDTLNWRRRVFANGGSVDDATLHAVNAFCVAIDAAGIRSRLYRLNLFCGANLAAALTPVFVSTTPTATTIGAATDTGVNFVTADFANSGPAAGLRGNGSTKRLDTGVLANIFPLWNMHMGVGMAATDTRLTSGYRTVLGNFNSGAALVQQFDVRRASNDMSFRNALRGSTSGTVALLRFRSAGIFPITAALPAGYYVATWPECYRDGVLFGDVATDQQLFTTAVQISVFGQRTSATTVTGFTDARLHWYSLGLYLDGYGASALTTATRDFADRMART